MSKRNIRPNSGKQLYLNQIFSRGMLYTSSEMQEGFAKIIDNYDISPAGDAATPRLPLRTSAIPFSSDQYIYPVIFKQINKYCYIAFNNTITEEDFANDTVNSTTPADDTIKVYTRADSNFNNVTEEFIYYGYNNVEAETDEQQQLRQTYISAINNSEFQYDTTNHKINTSLPIYDSENNELTTQDISLSPTQVNVALTSEMLPWARIIPLEITPPTITVIDGDTFIINNIKIRLLNVDTPELKTNDKWSIYAKIYLEKILNYFCNQGLGYYQIIYSGTTSYDRQIAKIKFYIRNNLNDEVYDVFDVGAMLLQLGLATIRYATISDNDYNKYIECSQYAQNNNLKLFSTNDFDPYYVPTYGVYGTDGNNLELSANQYIEVVKINSENAISAKTTVKSDFINCVYVDYLDAVGFIGRIIDPDDGIIYKGPIFIRAVINDEGNEIYSILLPTNNGDGHHPDLITAGSVGEYNIFSNNIIDLSNNTDNNPLTIYGIFPIIDYDTDNYKIVTQAVTGQEILLKAQITESPYYVSNNILTSTDNFGFEVELNSLYIGVNQYNSEGVITDPNSEYPVQIYDSITITRSINEYSNDTIVSLNIITILSNYFTTLNNDERTSFENYLKNKYQVSNVTDITWNTIFDDTNGLSILPTIKLQSLDKDDIIIKLNSTTISEASETITTLFPDCLLELYTYYEIDNSNEKLLYIHFKNNFSSINLTYDSEHNIFVSRQNFIPQLKFYQQWFVADANSTNFEAISNEELIFTSNGSITLSQVGTWDQDTIVRPTDLTYIINRSDSIIFKYSIQPKIICQLGNNCLPELQNLELKNTYQELYQVSNILKLGLTTETVSNESLKQNMDIHNATRINIFNRQIVLYGPYTTSNALFFSKFEFFDYYPFPNNVVEINEPIIWTYNYKDSFIIFGKYNIYMLSGGTTVLDCTLNKIYENLSTKLSDVNLIGTVGNNLIFFNNGEGYIIIPNTYVDSSYNIRIYKLTERISNFFYNPEEYIRLKFTSDEFNINTSLNFEMDFKLYVQNNDIYIIDNIKINNTYNIITWFIYNQDYKYWRMYSTKIVDRIIANAVFEAPLNNQFVVRYNNQNYIAYFLNTRQDTGYEDGLGTNNNIQIQTILNSGYLSVDTMNDKRFKDIIIEFDNIIKNSTLDINCEFFIDGSPIVISDTNILVTNKLTSTSTSETDKECTDYISTELISLDATADSSKTYTRRYGKAFKLDTETYNINGRTHVRIPVFGKGRLPLFVLVVSSDKYYEFINYALIYKEKNINRRN